MVCTLNPPMREEKTPTLLRPPTDGAEHYYRDSPKEKFNHQTCPRAKTYSTEQEYGGRNQSGAVRHVRSLDYEMVSLKINS